MPSRRDHVESELDALIRRNTVDALWRRDPSAWVAPSPGGTPAGEATGWLDLPGRISGLAGELNGFADDVRNDGYTDVVLLGMGGSSLGPLVLGRVFGAAPGYPRLHVLDSTVPGGITAVRDRVDLHRSLFLVSSKSGTTIEPLTLANYFRGTLQEIGVEKPDARFVALTDRGSSLERLSKERGFRHVFSTPADVGGRFSVLSRFGLLPAALIGVDLERLSRSAMEMAAACGPGADMRTNPGVLLGAALGGLAINGRDKITILTSPGLASFGLWVEQLLAESTGKNGRGLVPVAGEPLYDASDYGDDRNFVYLRLAGDANGRTDAHAGALETAGQPVTRLELDDRYDLGGEFFRWEFAVSVAATSISVYPFDQPDVESAKEFTREMLASSGNNPQTPADAMNIAEIIDAVTQAKPGDYVAILGYLPESAEIDSAISELRTAITGVTGSATTFGYGPRYLHSTGQLHKGGPDGVIALALVAGNEDALAAPRADAGGNHGADYRFESLFVAQVLGDLEALRAKGHRNMVAVFQPPYPDAIRELAASLHANPW